MGAWDGARRSRQARWASMGSWRTFLQAKSTHDCGRQRHVGKYVVRLFR
jgi:hypothetical protein